MKTKLVRPVLVESKEYKEGNIGLHIADNSLQIMQRRNLGNKFFDTDDGSPSHGIVIPQQLILISLEDEKIEENDYYYFSKSNSLHKHLGTLPLNKYKHDGDKCFKVIATQSQLSPEYIQKFINEYNKGEVKYIEIEMIEKIHNHYSGANAQWKELLPKLTNGFVTIVEKLQMPKISADDLPLTNGNYTEEDMLQAFIAGEQYCLMQENSTPNNALPFDKWMHNYKMK